MSAKLAIVPSATEPASDDDIQDSEIDRFMGDCVPVRIPEAVARKETPTLRGFPPPHFDAPPRFVPPPADMRGRYCEIYRKPRRRS